MEALSSFRFQLENYLQLGEDESEDAHGQPADFLESCVILYQP